MMTGNMRTSICFKIKTYHRSEVAWFHSSRDQHWSLWYMASGLPIVVGVLKWNSSEALYLACNYSSLIVCIPATRKINNVIPYVRKRIQAAATPMASKMTQRCAVKADLVRRDWADPAKETRIHAMNWVLEEKLFCNEIFKDALLATGNKPIVEVSRKDEFWGCKPISGDRLTGKNILGQLLTALRSRINEVRDGRMSYPCGWLP
jgi:predicted NAD-dependent protein-ADP-ribosyltransferase YbiA (DUF1768 family)